MRWRWLLHGLANFMTPGNHAIKQSCTPTPQTLSSGLNRKQKWSRGWGWGGGNHERKSGMKHTLKMKVYYTVCTRTVQENILERFKKTSTA